MRVILTIAAAVSLTACAYQPSPREVASAPPSVSYQVYGDDMSEANARADSYCRQFNAAARLDSLQPAGGQRIASYSCVGYPAPLASNGPTPYAPAPYVNSPPAAIRCADPMHQNLPGGTDYHGPAVYGCPPTY